jgi:hypothetical protein
VIFTQRRRDNLRYLQDEINADHTEATGLQRRARTLGFKTTTTHLGALVFTRKGQLIHCSDLIEAKQLILKLSKQ